MSELRGRVVFSGSSSPSILALNPQRLGPRIRDEPHALMVGRMRRLLRLPVVLRLVALEEGHGRRLLRDRRRLLLQNGGEGASGRQLSSKLVRERHHSHIRTRYTVLRSELCGTVSSPPCLPLKASTRSTHRPRSSPSTRSRCEGSPPRRGHRDLRTFPRTSSYPRCTRSQIAEGEASAGRASTAHRYLLNLSW